MPMQGCRYDFRSAIVLIGQYLPAQAQGVCCSNKASYLGAERGSVAYRQTTRRLHRHYYPNRIQPGLGRVQGLIQRTPLLTEELHLVFAHVGVNVAQCLQAVDLPA